MRSLHLMNAKNRDARVVIASVSYSPSYRMGLPGKTVAFRKYLAAAEPGTHDELKKKLGEDYGQALVDGDPEVDMELVGKSLGKTDTVYLGSKGEVLHAPPKLMDVILAPDGSEKERRDVVDDMANVNEELPVRWTGKKIPKEQAVRQFVFRRTIQLVHADGLTYDYLYDMAKELSEERVMVLVGAGKDGKGPLIFQTNGSRYRGFLEGRVDGAKYMLLLHLSNMELKRVKAAEAAGKEGE